MRPGGEALLHELGLKGPEMDAIRGFRQRTADVLPSTYGSSAWTDWDKHPAAGPWRAARGELMQRADAPLPAR